MPHLQPLQGLSFKSQKNPNVTEVLPCVVVDHFAVWFNKRIVDDFQLRVDDRHPGQLQTLFGITLFPEKGKKYQSLGAAVYEELRDSVFLNV